MFVLWILNYEFIAICNFFNFAFLKICNCSLIFRRSSSSSCRYSDWFQHCQRRAHSIHLVSETDGIQILPSKIDFQWFLTIFNELSIYGENIYTYSVTVNIEIAVISLINTASPPKSLLSKQSQIHMNGLLERTFKICQFFRHFTIRFPFVFQFKIWST